MSYQEGIIKGVHLTPSLTMQFNDIYIDGLAQDCSISIANALEILQSCSTPPICTNQQKKTVRHQLLFPQATESYMLSNWSGCFKVMVGRALLGCVRLSVLPMYGLLMLLRECILPMEALLEEFRGLSSISSHSASLSLEL